MGCLYDPAIVQQTSSKCIQNIRANCGRLLDRVNTYYGISEASANSSMVFRQFVASSTNATCSISLQTFTEQRNGTELN